MYPPIGEFPDNNTVPIFFFFFVKQQQKYLVTLIVETMRTFIVGYPPAIRAKLIDTFLILTTSKYARLASHFHQKKSYILYKDGFKI